jgi:FKBP-type peptidyl-prolyl cis-trans isomerase FkpA
MKIRSVALAVITGIMIFSASSCLKDDSEAQRAEEKRILNTYISANYPNVTPTKSGLYYIETLAGTGDTLDYGEWMEIKFTGRLVSSNDVVMTSDLQIAKDNNIDQTDIYYGPTRLILGKISYAGLNEGISKMKEGGKARMIFSSDLGAGGSSSSTVPAYSSLIFDIELLKVIPDMKAYETGLMMEYLIAHELSTDTTASGIYYTETMDGVGSLPIDGDQVSVTYTGKFLEGTAFQSTGKTFSFTVGSNGVIKGFEAGVRQMRKGGTATVVVPYNYAYGEYGRVDNYYRIVVPPFKTLVFNLTLNTITP